MKNKRLLLLFFCAILCLGINAKNEERTIAVLTLNDGTVVKGYASINKEGDKVTMETIINTRNRKTVKYSTDNVKSLVIPPSGKDTTTVTFVPILVHQPWYMIKNPSKPKMVVKVFETERMEGYVGPDADFTFTGNNGVGAMGLYHWDVNAYYYHIKGEKRAYGYWKDIIGSSYSLKRALKAYFKRFPDIVEFVEGNNVDKKTFINNPTMMLPLIDESIKNGNYQTIKEK